MNKKVIIITSSLLLLGGGIGLYFYLKNPKLNSKKYKKQIKWLFDNKYTNYVPKNSSGDYCAEPSFIDKWYKTAKRGGDRYFKWKNTPYLVRNGVNLNREGKQEWEWSKGGTKCI